MIEAMRRRGTTRAFALALIGLVSAAPAQAVDLAGSTRLQSLQQAVQSIDVADDNVAETVMPPQIYDSAGEGQASYYGNELAGNRTASGERFDPRLLTAAHRSLPIGSMVRVTNMANGRSVVVRVNDRGPFARSRIIDVSLAAAREIDLVRTGKAEVRLEVLRSIA